MCSFLFILLQGGPPGYEDWGDPDAAINQHLILLLIIGIALGAFSLLKSRIKNKHHE